KMGATDFIKKPFSSEEFYCRINNTIEMLDLVETVTHMQNRDFLTGAYNRTYFFETMRKEFAALRKEPRVNLAVAMIDIDDLKDLDKKYGQNIGDKAVKTVGKILLDETKGSDMVARFGGGEFCVVKKQIGKEEAFDFFDRLRFAIHSQDLGKDEEDNPISCTVSIGVDTEFEDTIEKMVNEADLLLYKAKEQGKNKTCYQ
ncbi:MAG: GGDEF domain-containing response regulator, partial [Campylobacterota bacterium]